jgi:hypothetical protein
MRFLDRLIAAGEDHEKAPHRAVALPSLRPYLPGRRHLRRVLSGLAVLVRMAWTAVRAGLRKAMAPADPKAKKKQAKAAEKAKTSGKASEEKNDQQHGFLDALERAGAAVLGVVIGVAGAGAVFSALWAQVAPYARTAVGVVMAVLLTAAWIVGPKEPKTPGESELPAAGGEAEPDPAPLPRDAEPLSAPRSSAPSVSWPRPRGWKGAHLDDVLALLPGRSRTELLEVLAEAEIPVTEQLKLTLPGGRQRNRQGIRLAHLPAAPDQRAAETPPGPPSPAAAEVAPEPVPPAAPLTVYGVE